jgi:hypothetical protein
MKFHTAFAAFLEQEIGGYDVFWSPHARFRNRLGLSVVPAAPENLERSIRRAQSFHNFRNESLIESHFEIGISKAQG